MSLRDYQLKFRQQQRHAADNHHNPIIHNDSIFAYLADDNVPEGWGRNGFSEIGGKSRSAENLERMTNASHYAEKYDNADSAIRSQVAYIIVEKDS